MIPQSVVKRASTLLVVVAPLTTLGISPWFNFDPINPIKIFLLTCLVFLALGLFIPYFGEVIRRVGRPTTAIITLFILCLLWAFLQSDADKSQQFWGVFGRGTGVLSYLSLSLLFLLANLLASTNFSRRVVLSIILTTALMTFYCLIQILKLDPISWSAFFPFGTLGNVNFLSGYMGIALVCLAILILANSTPKLLRLWFVLLFILSLFALYKSDSTQGIVALVIGIATYFVIRSWWINRYVFFLAFTSYLLGFASLVAGLFDRGPLREFIYSFTVLFRADYMHAAIEMLLKNPMSGVGIDSYDDWYRSERGLISALRTSLDRTSNSAHNIALDLGAGGGLPLLFSYLAVVALVLLSIIRGLKNGKARNPYFMAVSMAWIAYQVQASVSINQIGVGVWGWLFGGLIVGMARSTDDLVMPILPRRNKGVREKLSPNTPPPLPVILSVVSLSVGFALSYPPLKTDSDYFTATKRGSAEMIQEVAQRPTTNAFLLSKATEAVLNAGMGDASKELVGILIDRFPRSLYGQLVKYERYSSTEVDRVKSLANLKEIDPIVALCFGPTPEARLRYEIERLPARQRYELARGWGLVGNKSTREVETFTWTQVSQSDLALKLSSYCGRG